MDVLIFSGQSNMQGATEGCPLENEPVEGAWEYKVSSNEFVELKHPVGENLGDWLYAAGGGGGSLVPDFCRAYRKECGKDCIAIHVAKGGSTIGEWLYGTQRYYHAVGKIRAGIAEAKKNHEIEKVYFVWLQGESDAIIGTTQEEYLQRLYALKNSIKKDVGIDKFAIIRVGHFISVVNWNLGITQEEKLAREEGIMRAQDRAEKEDGDFTVLTRICSQLSKDPTCLNPYAAGHYNNESMEKIGEAAGTALGKIRNAEK